MSPLSDDYFMVILKGIPHFRTNPMVYNSFKSDSQDIPSEEYQLQGLAIALSKGTAMP
jgi:hypothetical protein